MQVNHLVSGKQIYSNCGTNMSMSGDWMRTTPAANSTTLRPILPKGVEKKPGSPAGLSCGIGNPFIVDLSWTSLGWRRGCANRATNDTSSSLLFFLFNSSTRSLPLVSGKVLVLVLSCGQWGRSTCPSQKLYTPPVHRHWGEGNSPPHAFFTTFPATTSGGQW